MNKHITNLVNNYNLTEVSKNHYSGIVNGYQYGLRLDNFGTSVAHIKFFTYLDDEKKNTITSFLEGSKGLLKISTYEVGEYYIDLSFTVFTFASVANNIDSATRAVSKKLEEIGALDKKYCPVCGDEIVILETAFCDGFQIGIDQKCKQVLMQKMIYEEQQFKSKPNNYLMGALGAGLFALIGAVIWVILGVATNSIFGYIAILVAFLAGFGYNKFGGKNDKMKIIIPAIVTVVILLISLFIIYYVILSNEMSKYNINGNVFEMLGFLFENDADFKGGVIKDIIITLVFSGIGILGSYSYLKKGMHNKKY